METGKPDKKELLVAICQASREQQLASLERLLRLRRAPPGRIFRVLHLVLVGGKNVAQRTS
jgi:hypothetical protein